MTVLAMHHAMECLPTLANHVEEVVVLRPREEMGRVYAWWVVAPMANVHPFRNRAEVDFIADTMRSQLSRTGAS